MVWNHRLLSVKLESHALKPLKVIVNEVNGLCIKNVGLKRRRLRPLDFDCQVFVVESECVCVIFSTECNFKWSGHRDTCQFERHIFCCNNYNESWVFEHETGRDVVGYSIIYVTLHLDPFVVMMWSVGRLFFSWAWHLITNAL